MHVAIIIMLKFSIQPILCSKQYWHSYVARKLHTTCSTVSVTKTIPGEKGMQHNYDIIIITYLHYPGTQTSL